VTLAGPAPDAQARERAAVLAAVPQGVRSVDNRLVVSAAGSS
jgi:osmotically-inducible protein OsmY